MKESTLRSLLKAISWRVVATAITFCVALLLTGETLIALEIGLLDTVIKLGAYFSHERLWGRLKVGKTLHPLEDIELTRDLEDGDKEIIKEKLKDLGYIDE